MSDSLGFKSAMVLCPHLDDGEMWCGGTMARLVDEGCAVRYVAFGYPRTMGSGCDVVYREGVNARKAIGDISITQYASYQTREYSKHRQRILDDLVDLNKEYSPDLIIMPSISDTHQDHSGIAHEAIRAFRKSTLISYETVRNDLSFNHTLIVGLTEDQLERKLRAVAEFKSQAFRPYFSALFIRSLATVRGTQIGVPYAEAFEVVKWIIR